MDLDDLKIMSENDNTTCSWSVFSNGSSPETFDEEIVRRPQDSIDHQHTIGSRRFRLLSRRRRRPEEHPNPAATWQTPRTYGFGALNVRTGSMDGGGSDGSSSSSAITVITSAASSCTTDPWSGSSRGFVEEDERDTQDGEMNWERERLQDEDEDMMLVPKLEPLDDDLDMAHVQEIPPTPSTTSRSPMQAKRPRGRPRKHPVPAPESVSKVTKGRSKTGCITCRKRKKKCDEAKPRCMNCEKNNAICEGYPDKTIWKSGKEKAEEGTTEWFCEQRAEKLIATTARVRRVSLPNITLQPVIHGVETVGDKVFFEHYIFRLSSIFTVEGEVKNAFKNMILPMAVEHLGLMHSILALSSKHLDLESPYGLRLLQDHPDVNAETLRKRSEYHHEEAMKELHQDIARQAQGDRGNMIISGRYGQMLCLILETLADPQPSGQHRIHLQAYQKLIREYPPEDGPFLAFIKEFFQYHIVLDDLISLPQGSARLGSISEDWTLPDIIPPDAVRLLGVSDGLFLYMSKITNIRNQIRKNMTKGVKPVVDYNSLYRAAEIDAGIREWTPVWPAGDKRDLSGFLYKQMMWVYLWRTIYPPKTTTWHPDKRITKAVDDGILLLSQVPPRDPAQTIVLAPAFMIGCAAFDPAQREPIRKAIGVVKAYMEYRNSDTALAVLEEVWRLMDAKDEKSWDWQAVANGMGMDFLAT